MSDTRRPATTPEEAASWLSAWTNEAFIPPTALPKRPWQAATDREIQDAADALVKVRARVWPGHDDPMGVE